MHHSSHLSKVILYFKLLPLPLLCLHLYKIYKTPIKKIVVSIIKNYEKTLGQINFYFYILYICVILNALMPDIHSCL